MSVSVVIPTLASRAELLARTMRSLRETVPAGELELITVRDRPCIGRAWNDGAARATGEYLALWADDVEAQPGWLEAATDAADAGNWPAPHLVKTDGSVLACGSMGGGWLLTEAADWAPVVSSQFPFMRREHWDEIGPCLEIHYFSDDYLAARARALGLGVVYRRGYALRHLEGLPGRAQMVARSQADREAFEASLATMRWEVAVA